VILEGTTLARTTRPAGSSRARQILLRLPRTGERPPDEERRRHAATVASPAPTVVRLRNGEQGTAGSGGRHAYAPDPTGSPHGAPADRGELAEDTILVVDDDPAILATVEEILTSEGYDVATAINGAQALEAIERARPALVLLDMRMPVLDGWGFARELRTRGVAVPVLVMTAAQDARRWAAEIAADGYLPKPFRLLDLLDAVERFVPPPVG
jgi:CheY-like chemotaxis protein